MYYFINFKKIFLFFICICLIAPVTTHAFGLSPKKIEISGDPGEVILGGVSLFSDQTSLNETYTVSFENFRPKGNSGIPQFTGDIDGLATWFSSEPQISFNGSSEAFFSFSIAIPQDARPGGYFSAIFFEPQIKQKSSTDEKIGVLVFLRVNGEISEEGRILSFSLKNNKKIATREPLFFEYRFKNDGEDRVIPKGSIQIFNIVNSKIAEFSIDGSTSNVLPGSFRRFETIFPNDRGSLSSDQGFLDIVKNQFNNFKFGFYKARITVEWGQDKIVESRDFKFFFLPWHLLSVCLIILSIIFFIIRYFLILQVDNLIKQPIDEPLEKVKQLKKITKVKVKTKKNKTKKL